MQLCFGSQGEADNYFLTLSLLHGQGWRWQHPCQGQPRAQIMPQRPKFHCFKNCIKAHCASPTHRLWLIQDFWWKWALLVHIPVSWQKEQPSWFTPAKQGALMPPHTCWWQNDNFTLGRKICTRISKYNSMGCTKWFLNKSLTRDTKILHDAQFYTIFDMQCSEGKSRKWSLIKRLEIKLLQLLKQGLILFLSWN